MELVFLGTGGGRWTTITQRLKTGGFRLNCTKKIHIDPGPGALINSYEFGNSPLNTDGIIVTHCHPDHYNDAEIMIEAMTRGMTKKRGFLMASESVLYGKRELGPCISDYHKKLVECKVLAPRDKVHVDDIEIEALETKHSDPTTVGIKFSLNSRVITYTSDTEFFEGLVEQYENSDVIIFNVLRPKNERIPWHLCTNDVIEILNKIKSKPELAILNHFGMKMVGVQEDEARRVSRETGVKTIAAKDGMRLKI